MNKEKIRWLNFLLKFYSIDLGELKGSELLELATELDFFIFNDTVSNPGTTIKNLVILKTGDGWEDIYEELIRDIIIYEIKEIQNGVKSDIKALIELIETTGSKDSNYKLERGFETRLIVSFKEGKFCLTEGTGHSINEILLFKFQKCMADVPISFFHKCPECDTWFVHATKRIKTYCTKKCTARFLMRKKRQVEKVVNPEKYKEELKEGSKRARKSYEKRVQKGNPNIKVASRPTKHKKGD